MNIIYAAKIAVNEKTSTDKQHSIKININTV